MQFQADILGVPVVRPKILETTALGAAYLAGLAVGYWRGFEEIELQWQRDSAFHSVMDRKKVADLVRNWDRALVRAKNWIVDSHY